MRGIVPAFRLAGVVAVACALHLLIAPPSRAQRVSAGQQAVYTFDTGTGSTVFDVSGVGSPMDLTIADPGNVTWVPGGGLTVNAATTIATPGPATKIIDAAKASEAITVEAWITPGNTTQFGPARIVALSQSGLDGANFVLGQGSSSSVTDNYLMRLRTTSTNKYGMPSLDSPAGAVITALTHVVYTREAGGARRLYVNGVEVASGTIAGSFSSWINSLRLGLANEAVGGRPWLGTLHLVAIFDRALTAGEVQQNFAVGPVTTTAPQIVQHPEDQYTEAPQPATFTVAAEGDEPITFQWQRFNTSTSAWDDIPGETAASYNLAITGISDDGALFRCVATNDNGDATSDEAMLTVVPTGTTYTLNISVSGSGTVVKTPDQPTYSINDVVQIDAVPNSNRAFLEWSGGLTGFQDPLTLVMRANVTATATFVSSITDPIPAPVTFDGTTVEIVDFLQLPATDSRNPELGRARVNIMREVPDGSGRLFVNDMRGPLYVVNGASISTYADLFAVFPDFVDTAERMSGFNSFAFHPAFGSNGKFYTTHFESAGAGTADLGESTPHPTAIGYQGVLTEWTASNPSSNVFSGSRRELLRIDFPSQVHPLTDLSFNPNAGPSHADYGKLYVCVGDGGGVQFGNPTLQHRLDSILGTLIRIDPAGTNGRNGQYGIPPDNPFVDGDPNTLDEIWAWGFRDPHRISWDTGGSGALLVSDVGEKNLEEINVIVKGGDYGWPIREGTFMFDPYGNLNRVYQLPSSDALGGFTYPVAQYDRSEGVAVTGGFVYRGSALPQLAGRYVFGDIVSGRVFFANADAFSIGSQTPVIQLQLEQNGNPVTLSQLANAQPPVAPNRADLRWAMDAEGELYAMTKTDGMIRKLVPAGGSTPSDFAGSVEVNESGQPVRTLNFGTAPDATDGTDAAYDAIMPPPGPSGFFEARFACTAQLTCEDDLSSDFRATIEDGGTISWRLHVQRANATSEVLLDWGGTTFPSGDFRLRDAVSGTLVDVDMKLQSSYNLTNDAVSDLLIVFTFGTTAPAVHNADVVQGWNLVGLPVAVVGGAYETLFPSATPNTLYAFSQSAGYTQSSSLALGRGYWLHFGAASVVPVSGSAVNSLQVHVSKGWNLIAGPSCDVPAGNIADPLGIVVAGSLFWYDGASYAASASVPQGRGLWVKATADGIIGLSCSAAPAARVAVSGIAEPEGFGILSISDAQGRSRDLLFGGRLPSSANPAAYELPPLPPAGAFDVRFEGDSRLTESPETDILIQTESYPLTIARVRTIGVMDDVWSIDILDVDGSVLSTHDLDDEAGFDVSNADVKRLRLYSTSPTSNERPALPESFALLGNYPNPLADATTIVLDVPAAGSVEVVVVDLLGRVASRLPNVELQPGAQRRILLDTSGLAAGTYIYRLVLRAAGSTEILAGRMVIAR